MKKQKVNEINKNFGRTDKNEEIEESIESSKVMKEVENEEESKETRKDMKEQEYVGINKEDEKIKNFKKRKRIDCWDKETISVRLQELEDELKSKKEKCLSACRIKRIKQRIHILKSGLKGELKVGGHLKKLKKKNNKRKKLKLQEKQKRNAEKKKQNTLSEKKRKISKNIVCLRCKKRGHLMKDCRLNEQDILSSSMENKENSNFQIEKEVKQKPSPSASGICFNCGSTDHILKHCKKLRKKDGLLPFALCFICQKAGHISAHCPQNENGVYPNGGGCRFCGSKYHFVAECPEKPKDKHEKKKLNKKNAKTLNNIQNKLCKKNANEKETIKTNDEPTHHSFKDDEEDPDEYWIKQSKLSNKPSLKSTKKKFFVKKKKY